MTTRLATLKDVTQEFGNRTVCHGLRHFFQSRGRVRQTFWLLLFTASLIAGSIHTAITVKKYIKTSVKSQLNLMSEEATFPDVTICNLKPASASLTSWIDFAIYTKDHWNFFDNWFKDESKKNLGESEQDYEGRLHWVCKKLLDVMWVSADTRDISHLDETMLLHCKYNGVPCTHDNFSLVQTSRFWNCYTFHADSRHHSVSGARGLGAELDMVLFTDGYHKTLLSHPASDKISPNVSSSNAENQENCFLKLVGDKYAINQVLLGEEKESTGLRVFIHEERSFPLSRSEIVDVASGSSAKIRLRPIRNRLLPTPHRSCSEPPLEKVRYVRYFSDGSMGFGTREYTKSVADFVVEAKQKMIHENCGCYSHRHPFQVNTSELCYFAPPEHWKTPSDAVLRNIRCHDDWFERAEKRSSELAKEFRHRRWCEYTRHRPWQQSFSWPPFESVAEIWDQMIVPKIKYGVEFLPTDGRKYHIFNEGNLSRQVFHFFSMLLYDKACFEFFCKYAPSKRMFICDNFLFASHYHKASQCVEQRSLAQNLAAVRISLEGPAADAYVEEAGSHWTEALSEIGGTFGLWLGISIVSGFELLEFVYVLVRNCIESRANTNAIIDSTAQS